MQLREEGQVREKVMSIQQNISLMLKGLGEMAIANPIFTHSQLSSSVSSSSCMSLVIGLCSIRYSSSRGTDSYLVKYCSSSSLKELLLTWDGNFMASPMNLLSRFPNIIYREYGYFPGVTGISLGLISDSRYSENCGIHVDMHAT